MSGIIITKEPTSGSASSLRAGRVNGSNNLFDRTYRIWRLQAALERQQNSSGGQPTDNRFRAVILGDSVACKLAPLSQNTFGPGGSTYDPAISNDWTYSSVAVTTDYEQWAVSPKGQITSIPAGQYISTPGTTSDYGPFGVLIVHYLAGSGNGSFKVSYQANKTGSWTDVTTAVITNGTTANGSVASGVVNTNNSGAATYSQALFTMPYDDIYNVRIASTSGTVKILGVFTDGGAYNSQAFVSGQGNRSGAMDIDFSRAGRQLAADFQQTPQATWNAAMGFANPHVIVYKSANGWSLTNYQSYWDAYATRVMTAAPKALFVVVSSHPRGSNPTNADAGDVAVDDFLRNWCANKEGAIFVDVRQSFPAWSSAYLTATTLAEDLWSDTDGTTSVHIYSGNSANPAGGDSYVRALVWDALRPAINALRLNDTGEFRVKAEPANVEYMWGAAHNGSAINNREGKKYMIHRPGTVGGLLMMTPKSFYNSGNQQYENTAGFTQGPSEDSNVKNALTLVSDGRDVLTWNRNIYGQCGGFLAGVPNSSDTYASRTGDGFRFFAPSRYYTNNGVIVESRSADVVNDASCRLFGLDHGASEASAGNKMWSWYADGTQKYHGTAGTYATTFTYDTPTANTSVNVRLGIAGSSSTPRAQVALPSYVAAANAAVDSNLPAGAAYYDEASSTVKIKASAIVTKSTNYTATIADGTILASGAITLTLPAASSCPGKVFMIKKTDATTTLTIAASTGNVEGNANLTTTTLGAAFQLQSDGSNWYKIN
jgi:hypothetical protein